MSFRQDCFLAEPTIADSSRRQTTPVEAWREPLTMMYCIHNLLRTPRAIRKEFEEEGYVVARSLFAKRS